MLHKTVSPTWNDTLLRGNSSTTLTPLSFSQHFTFPEPEVNETRIITANEPRINTANETRIITQTNESDPEIQVSAEPNSRASPPPNALCGRMNSHSKGFTETVIPTSTLISQITTSTLDNCGEEGSLEDESDSSLSESGTKQL